MDAWAMGPGNRERRMSRPVSRILFSGALRPSRSVTIHLGLPSPTGSCGLPADSGGQPSNVRADAATASSWPCSGWGLPSHPGHPGCWWSLTPPFHPYPAKLAGRSVFCGTVPRVAPGCRWQPPCPVESGLSSMGSLPPRSPSRLIRPVKSSRAARPPGISPGRPPLDRRSGADPSPPISTRQLV